MCPQATPAAARPLVKVYDGATGAESGSVPLPSVFTAPIRRDLVHFVHTNMAKNKSVGPPPFPSSSRVPVSPVV